MTYDARKVANWFADHAKERGESMPITKLLKLIYISHGWYLALHNKPLYLNKIEAWRFGPVVPDVYYDFRNKRGEVKNNVKDAGPLISEADKILLRDAYDIYGDYSTEHLSGITHTDDGPWDSTIKNVGWRAEISNDLIKQHYDEKLLKSSEN